MSAPDTRLTGGEPGEPGRSARADAPGGSEPAAHGLEAPNGSGDPGDPGVPGGAGVHGTVLFTRYAFMPNHLQRCGPLRAQDNRTIFEYAVAGETDPYFTSLLREFQAAYPYLQLIARTTGYRDPFDPKVVEAYWIGSDLLDGVEVRQFHDSLEARFGKQVNRKQLQYLLGKAPAGARPHHSFNVFDVQRFTQEQAHSLHYMEKCRIGWGRVQAVEAGHFVVEYQPLVWSDPSRSEPVPAAETAPAAGSGNGAVPAEPDAAARGGLALGAPVLGRVLRQMDGKGFADRAVVGDWITFHWDWACDRISEQQRAQLERWTKHHLRLASETL